MHRKTVVGIQLLALALVAAPPWGCGSSGIPIEITEGELDVTLAGIELEEMELPEPERDPVSRLSRFLARIAEVLQTQALRLHLKELLPGNPKPAPGDFHYLPGCPGIILLPLFDGSITLDYSAAACAGGGGDRGGEITATRLAAGLFVLTFMDDFFLDGEDIDGSLLFTRDGINDNMYTVQNSDAAGNVAAGMNLISITGPSQMGIVDSTSEIEIDATLTIEGSTPPDNAQITGEGAITTTIEAVVQTDAFCLGRLPDELGGTAGTYPEPIQFDFPAVIDDDPSCRCPSSGQLYIESRIDVTEVVIDLNNASDITYTGAPLPITLDGFLVVEFTGLSCGDVTFMFEEMNGDNEVVLPIATVCASPLVGTVACNLITAADGGPNDADGTADGNLTIDVSANLQQVVDAMKAEAFPNGVCDVP